MRGEERRRERGQRPGRDAEQDSLSVDEAVFHVGDQRGRRTGEKIQQIDAAGGELRHSLEERQPEHEQRAAADAAAAQHPGQQTGEKRPHSSSTARTPP